MTNVTDWKTALSTSAIDLETLCKYRACGIEAIEVSRKWELYDMIDWPALRADADRAGIEIWSLHLPFSNEINIAAPEEEKRRSAVRYQCSLIEKASAIGISRFIIHPSAEPIDDEERPVWMASACRSLAELAAFADMLGGVICVEDLPRTCLGHTVEEMQVLLAADERLRVCFDVNHLLTAYGSTHQEFVDKLGDKIITTHMSDYDFVDEKHFFPGNGLLDWKMVIEALEAAGYCGPFLFEGGFEPSFWAPEVPYGKIEDAHERHMQIKQFRGQAAVQAKEKT